MSLRKLIGVIHPRMAVVVHDLLMAALAWWIAKALRYALVDNAAISFHTLEFPLVLLVQGAVLSWTGLYKGGGAWRACHCRGVDPLQPAR
jgi:uncharacterized membrane protein YjgN (DUF898 family)